MIFTLLTVARVRQWLVDALPPGLTHSSRPASDYSSPSSD